MTAFCLFSLYTHTVNTMGFTIRRELKSSAADLSWGEETSSQASKAIKMSILEFPLSYCGYEQPSDHSKSHKKSEKTPVLDAFSFQQKLLTPREAIVYILNMNLVCLCLYSLVSTLYLDVQK